MDESGDDSEGASSRSARKKPPPASTETLYFPSDQDPITLENVNDARERSFRKGVLSKVAEIGTQLGLLTEKPGPNAKPCFRSCKGRSLIRKSDSKCRGSHFQLAGRGSANALRLQLLQACQMQYYGDSPRPPQPLASLQPPTLTFPPPAAVNPANFNPPWATLASVGMPPGMPPQPNQPSELLAAAAQTELPQKAAPLTHTTAPNGERTEEICKNFARFSKCKFGSSCRYLHLEPGDPRTHAMLGRQRPKTPPAPEEQSKVQQGLGALSLNLGMRTNPNPDMKGKPG